MVLTLLLPLLASLQNLPRPATPADLLPAPTLLSRAKHTVYPPGEQVILLCSPPHDKQVGGYRFFFQKGQQGPTTVLNTNTVSWLEFTAEKGSAGSYTCAYWIEESNEEISSGNSSFISITVTAPKLTVSQPQPVYITGEAVTLTCSAAGVPAMSGIRFFRDGQEIQSKKLPSLWDSYTDSLQLSDLSGSQSGVFTCEFWKTVYGQNIPSETSRPISIVVIDPPLQPVLSMDPPSGVVSKGLPLFITCTAPGDAGERKFHFYNDGVEIVLRNGGSEISTLKSSSSSVNISLLSIPWAGPNDSGEFTCGYEDNVNGRWIPSFKSQAVNITVNVTMTAHSSLWVWELVVGVSFFLINSLIFLNSFCCF